MSGGKALLVCNSAWAVANFRMAAMRALRGEGMEVVVAAPDDGARSALEEEGFRLIPWKIEGRGTHPVHELAAALALGRIIADERPAVCLNYTIKPAIYGSLASWLLGVRSIAVITGLGYAFIDRGRKARAIRGLYRPALRAAGEIWFLNEEDRRLFVEQGLARAARTVVLPGEGVDTERFAPRPARHADGTTVFLMLSRLIYEKGIAEYFDAARALKRDRHDVRFLVAGPWDEGSPHAPSRAELAVAAAEGGVEYLGRADDVRPLIAAADFVVLPSYREGLPRALLEAASMGKPLIATNAPGCRELVREGETGFFAEPRSSLSLEAALRKALDLGRPKAEAMGRRGRQLVIAEYGDERIAEIYRSRVARPVRNNRKGE
jgi:glycosyltransferase involved in cell wall biosynthesis